MNLRGRHLLNRRILVSALGWVGGACAAVVVAMLALSLIGEGLSAGRAQPLSAEPTGSGRPPSMSAAPRVPVATGPSSSPTPSAQATRAPAAVTRLLTSSGGTAVARCLADRVYLVSWSPAQGYRVDRVWRGPGRLALVSFESSRREVTIEARCISGTPDGRVYVGRPEPPGASSSPTPDHEDDASPVPTRADR